MINCRNLFCLLFLLMIISCGGGSSEVGGSSSSSGGNSGAISESKWNEADLPLTLALSSSIPSNERTAISNSMDEWDNAVSGVNLFGTTQNVNDLEHSNLESYRDTILGIYDVESGDPLSDPSIDDARALAVTQFYAIVEGSSYRIIHADIFVNKRYYTFSTITNPTSYDYASVLVHEIGHLLGLGHVSFSTGDSVMNPSISTTTQKRTLFGIDDNNINDLYNSGSGASGRKVSALSPGEIDEDKIVRVVTQLMPNNECHHYEDGKLVKKHKVHLSLK